MKSLNFTRNIFSILVLAFTFLLVGRVEGQVAYVMSNGNYSEQFSNISNTSNWPNGFNGIDCMEWGNVAVNSSGTIGDGVKTTVSTESFSSGSTSGVQRGTNNFQFLSTSTSNSCAIDLFLDFTGRTAGIISFDVATVFNSTGNRDSRLKLFYSINGTSWVEITGSNFPFTARNNVAGSASVNLSLPSAFDNISTARLRFYEYSTTGGGSTPTGSQPKISIDNISVTSSPATIPVFSLSGSTSHGTTCINSAANSVTYTISNTGTSASNVVVTSSDPQFVVSNLSSTSIASNGTATFNVVFTPTSSGLKSSTISVFYDNTTLGTTLSISGTGNASVTGVVSSSAATSIVNTTASLNGNLSTLGVCPATIEKGFVYSNTSNNADPIVGGSGVTKTAVSGIATGVYSLALTGLVHATNYSYKAYIFDGTSYIYGTASNFTTKSIANQISFGSSPPSSASMGVNMPTFTVEARRADNSVDPEYTGAVTLTSSGTISGNSAILVNGVATFSSTQFTTNTGVFTLTASLNPFADITSGSITVNLANATSILWSSTSGTTWLTTSNWTGSVLPSASQVAQFGLNTSSGNIVGINMNTLNGSMSIGAIEFTSDRTSPMAIGNSSPTVNGVLTLTGVVVNLMSNVILSNNSSQLMTLRNSSSSSGTQTMDIALGNSTNNFVNISNSGDILISSIISGVTKNLTKIGTGTGILQLTGANTYSGLTTVSGGTLQLNRTGGGTLPSGNSVTVNSGGLLRISSNQTLNNLTINAGGTVIVEANDQLTITGILTNSGTLTLENGATLVQGATSIIAGSNGSYNVKQDITGNGSSSPTGRFWYIGSPVSQASSAVFFTSSLANVAKKRDESSNAWVSLNSGSPENLEVGRGYYTQAIPTTSTITFTGGTINNGSITTNNLTSSGSGFQGFNLVSNPYPSYIDWTTVTKTNVGTTMWYRTHDGSGMNFGTVNGSGVGTTIGATTVTKYIPPMQSFWVRVSNFGQAASLTFNNTDRSHFIAENNSVAGLKSTNENDFVLIRMNLKQAEKMDQLIVYTEDQAANGLDHLDADKMMQANYPQFYTNVGGKKIVINALNAAKKQQALPVTIELPITGVHSFVVEDLEISNGLVWLEDKQEEIIQALEPGTVYEFYANSGINSERFVLHFQLIDDAVPTNVYNEVNSSANFSGKGASVYAESAGVVVIKLPSSSEGVTDIQIRDAAGKLVYAGSMNNLETSVELAQANGIYYVTLSSNTGVEVRKVFIQQ